jgi:hypothetical protein
VGLVANGSGALTQGRLTSYAAAGDLLARNLAEVLLLVADPYLAHLSAEEIRFMQERRTHEPACSEPGAAPRIDARISNFQSIRPADLPA